jgi:peptidoglycan-associated lipoprotein
MMFFKRFKYTLQILSFSALLFSACTTTKDIRNENFDYYGNNLNRNIGDVSDPSSIAYFEQNIGNKIYFETNDHELTQEAIEAAENQMHWLASKPQYKVIIEGHCDERGTREHNIALGERRAFELKKYFIQNGIQSGKISVISYGKEKPEVFGSNEETWRLNRRAVIILE